MNIISESITLNRNYLLVNVLHTFFFYDNLNNLLIVILVILF
jgi:hypothetical protein